MTVERLRALYQSSWHFHPKYANGHLDELVYRNGSARLHVRSPTEATLLIGNRVHTGTLEEMLDRLGNSQPRSWFHGTRET